MDGAIIDPPDGVELDPTKVVRIGRAGSSELKVHDQHVEVHHARLYFDAIRDQWIIEDLKSGHGTFVNGECVRGASRVVKPGAELRFGDARVRMTNTMRLPWWALLPGMFAGLLVVLAVLLVLWTWSRPSATHVITLDRDGVLTPAGRVHELPADAQFLRERGLSWNLKKVRPATDGNEDGIDELWLDVNGEKELIITFDEQNRWVELGLLPPGGVVNRAYGYPEVDIRGERWRMDPKRGHYRPFEHDAPVVWYRTEKLPPRPDPAAAPHPAPSGQLTELPGVKPVNPLLVTRLSLRDEALLGQFLSERGVHVPVHYIICEGAFEGVRAQVLTYEEEVLPLVTGCIGELHMEITELEQKGLVATPYAIALTPVGWRALVDDVVTFYTGSHEGLFVDSHTRPIVEQVRKDPGFHKTGRLSARPSNPVPGHNPIPNVEAEVSRVHSLSPTELHAAAHPAKTLILPTPRQPVDIDLDPQGGCEVLRVTLAEFEPGTWSWNRDFATLEEVGCGAPRPVLTVGYDPGIHAAKIGKHDIRLQIEADTFAKVTRVRRVRLSWR
jgi:hypothetical protein